jgi:hypothetical protein
MDMMNEILKLEKEGKLNEAQKVWFRKTKPSEELYDVENDPFELKNLATEPAYESKLRELRQAHEQWERDTRDLGFTNEKELYLSMWPNGIQPQTKDVGINYDRKTSIVSLTCDEPGASIVYRTSSADKAWQLYTKPFKVAAASEVRAVAIRYGFKQSGESVLVVP